MAFDGRPGADLVHAGKVGTGFTGWTRDGMLRHPRVTGVRTDEDAGDVVRET